LTLTNSHIAELMALEAAAAEGHRQRAYRRASSGALMWPVEAAALVAEGRSLTDLPAIGPRLSARIEGWLKDPPVVETPPPIRRDFMTLAEARAHLAGAPSWRETMQGDLQMHTVASDGSLPLADMAAEVEARGFTYMAVTDHSHGLRVVKGLDEAALARQGKEIDRLNKDLGRRGSHLHVLRALEMNLDTEGNGDMAPDSLVPLDLVLGSFHSKLRGTEDQTDRYLAALRNPHVHVLAHPRGRKFDTRPGLNADWDRVFKEALELDKALEINSYPDRQDLQGELLGLAAEIGIKLSIGTDAHAAFELDFVDLALANAERAGVNRSQIINFKPVDELLAWTASLKSRAST
jgi:histidinol phosphatase-like PHP family hydrolase